jgi:GntR family transcriptional regulator/MocR family aminotransferase
MNVANDTPAAGCISMPRYHRSGEQGLLLGFAVWNAIEIDMAASILGRIVR